MHRMRRPPGPRFRRWPRTDASPLLHELGIAALRKDVVRSSKTSGQPPWLSSRATLRTELKLQRVARTIIISMNSSLPTFREPTAVEKIFNRVMGFVVGLGLGPS